MLEAIARLNHLYERFNARDVEGGLADMQPDVQWAEVASMLIPEKFSTDGLGRLVIEGRLQVRDRSGTLLADGRFKHAYTFKDGLVQRMDVL